MKASLIIAIYNNIPFLKAVLDSISYQTEKDIEIIIAEDGENAEVKEFINHYPFKQQWQHLTQKDEGWGKNKAMNRAVKASKADWLIFIDGDCVLHHRFIEMHLRYADEKSVLAGKRVKLDKTGSDFVLENSLNIQKLQKQLVKKLLFGKGSIRYIEEGIFISPDKLLGFIPGLRTLNHLTGSNMSFSKKAIQFINGFDEDYQLPAVGEDLDLTWRFDAAGFKHQSVRNLAVQYHLQHKENWIDQNENMVLYRNKQRDNKYVCTNGLLKI